MLLNWDLQQHYYYYYYNSSNFLKAIYSVKLLWSVVVVIIIPHCCVHFRTITFLLHGQLTVGIILLWNCGSSSSFLHYIKCFSFSSWSWGSIYLLRQYLVWNLKMQKISWNWWWEKNSYCYIYYLKYTCTKFGGGLQSQRDLIHFRQIRQQTE